MSDVHRRHSIARACAFAFPAIVLFIFPLTAAPYRGEVFLLKQPDGPDVKVRVFGDEFHQYVESMDGYTLLRDARTGYICYADISADSSALLATNHSYSGDTMRARLPMQKHLRIKRECLRVLREAGKRRINPRGSAPDRHLASGRRARSADTNVTALTVLVDFPDKKSSITKQVIDDLFNKKGYSGYSNGGSLYDYFYKVSHNRFTYTCITTDFITMDKPFSHYDTIGAWNNGRVKEFLLELIAKVKTLGIDPSRLTPDDNGNLRALNILYAGEPKCGWADGLWPHQGCFDGDVTVGDVRVYKYQMTNIGTNPSIGVACHENGHMLFDWPDLYNYENQNDESCGIGPYCIMFSGDLKRPPPPNPYFRMLAGWETVKRLFPSDSGKTMQANAGANDVYHFGPNTEEFFLLESIVKSGPNATGGLAVWHIFRNGYNSYTDFNDLVKLCRPASKLLGNPLYSKSGVDSFGMAQSNWYGGKASGLAITNIGPAGSVMDFTVRVSAPLSLAVISPAKGESFTGGDFMNIIWEHNIPQPVTITLLGAGAAPFTITASTDKNGAYLWQIPESFTPGETYRIAVTNASNPTHTDTSDGAFSIQAFHGISGFPYTQTFDSLPDGSSLPDGWKQEKRDLADWTVCTGITPNKKETGKTGADGDHTSSQGKYLLAAYTGHLWYFMGLKSPVFDLSATSNPCLTFWCHMFSGTPKVQMGTLEIDIIHDGKTYHTITSLEGNHGDGWFKTTVDLSRFKCRRVQVVFDACIGTGKASDICLDDFSITDGNPNEITQAAAPRTDGYHLHYADNRVVFTVPRMDAPSKTRVKLDLFSMQGKKINIFDAPVGPGPHPCDIAAMNIAPGIYICRMIAGKRTMERLLSIYR